MHEFLYIHAIDRSCPSRPNHANKAQKTAMCRKMSPETDGKAEGVDHKGVLKETAEQLKCLMN